MLRKKHKPSNEDSQSTKFNEDVFNQLNISTTSTAFKRYNNADLLTKVDIDYVAEVKEYWNKNYGEGIDPTFHLAFMNFTGEKHLNLVSPNIMTNDIVPFFNDPKMRGVYKDKNIYDKLINAEPSKSVEPVLKRIYGTYYDKDNNIMSSHEAHSELLKYNEDLIIKPSNTNNGEGVSKLTVGNSDIFIGGNNLSMNELEQTYGGHFVIQRLIKQHPIIAAPHPDSVNTLRMVTFRWKNEIKHLLTFARFGANKSIQDNAGAGGVCLGVNDSGEFLKIAIDEKCQSYTHHPTTGYCFADLDPIPNYNEFKKYVIELHKDILHHDFVSWDIAIGEEGQPVFLEMNLRGATWLYQLAAQKPLFGDLTKDVIQYVSREQNNENSPRKKILTEQQKKEKQIKKQRKEIRNLKSQIDLLNKEIANLKSELEN